MREVLVNRLGGLSLPRKSVVRLAERPDMTSAVYIGRKKDNNNNNNMNNSCRRGRYLAAFAISNEDESGLYHPGILFSNLRNLL